MVSYATALAHAQLQQQKHIQLQAGMHNPAKRLAVLKQMNADFLGQAGKEMAYFQVGANVRYEDTYVILVLQLLKERMEHIRQILTSESLPARVLEDHANAQK